MPNVPQDLEAMSVTGQCLFVVLAAVFSLLTYRLLRRKGDDELSEGRKH